MSCTVVFLLLALRACRATAANYGNATVTEIASVYDVETFRVSITGWPPTTGKRITTWVRGVDAREMKAKFGAGKFAARAAMQVIVSLLRSAKGENCAT